MRPAPHPTARHRVVTAALLLVILAPCANAQTWVWGDYPSAPPFGAANTAVSQTFAGNVAGNGPGSGSYAASFSVQGGSQAWNGFGVGGNDDGYFSAPDQPIAGITFINGGPGYNNGIAQLAPISLTTGYNPAGAPNGLVAPTSNQQAIYFDAADGTTAQVNFDFSTLRGGALAEGSWLFLDSVDQGEALSITAAAGWIANIHVGDSSLPRPSSPIPLPISVSEPTFPACTPAITQSSTTLQLLGRYGDISAAVPTCSHTPVPVPGQTVGYTKGTDAVGVWIETAIPLTSLAISAIDSDPSTSNGMGGFTGPDNNFVLGVGVIAQTFAPLGTPRPIPTLSGPALLLAMSLIFGLFVLSRRSFRS